MVLVDILVMESDATTKGNTAVVNDNILLLFTVNQLYYTTNH